MAKLRDELSERSKSLVRTASHSLDFVWHGPTWMNRMAGEMPHQAPKNEETKMKKVLGIGGLTMMSTAAIIGSGIFVLTGQVAAPNPGNNSGPGVIVSYVIGGIVATLSAMCYMEFASETNTTGASIVYSCKIFGKLMAWLVAIHVLMELIIAAAAVATGFSGYLASLIKILDETGPHRLDYWGGSVTLTSPGANGTMLTIDLVAAATVLIITLLLICGVQQAEWVQNTCTTGCLISIIMSIITGAIYSKPSNWIPFAPGGFDGVFRGASVVFFAYLGFEMMAAAPEEAINAKRDVPLGIGISVLGCAVLYVLMALVITGMVPSSQINIHAPFSEAFKAKGAYWMAIIVAFGGLAGILDTIVVVQYSMSRTFVMLGRMGLVPPILSRVHPRTQTPVISVLFCGAVSTILALFVPLSDLADLTSLGALFAFFVVSSAVLFRRYYQRPSELAYPHPGLTGRKGAPLWVVLIPFFSIVGASVGLAFGYATNTHYGVWVAMGAWWLIATTFMWLCLPQVFRPVKVATPLFPWWPTAGMLTTMFLIGSLGLKDVNGGTQMNPANWIRWGYACLMGVVLFGLSGVVELIYNKIHGAPPPRALEHPHDGFDHERDVCSGDDIIDCLPVTNVHVDGKGVVAGASATKRVDGYGTKDKDVLAVDQA